MFGGTPGFSGCINSGSGGGPPGSSDYTPFGPYVCNAPGGPVEGLNTFIIPGLAGGSGLTTIIVSNTPETEDFDYTVDYSTGEITRNNPWVGGNTLAGAFKSG